MFAIVKTGGKQYKVQKDDIIKVEKLDVKAGDKIDLDNVLFISDNGKATIGEPTVKGAKVACEVVAQDRAAKITVFKKKRRQNYRRKAGHRQDITVLRVKDVKAA